MLQHAGRSIDDHQNVHVFWGKNLLLENENIQKHYQVEPTTTLFGLKVFSVGRWHQCFVSADWYSVGHGTVCLGWSYWRRTTQSINWLWDRKPSHTASTRHASTLGLLSHYFDVRRFEFNPACLVRVWIDCRNGLQDVLTIKKRYRPSPIRAVLLSGNEAQAGYCISSGVESEET